MALRVRRSVWSLEPGDRTLEYYRRAVEVMIAGDPNDPTSWRYLGAVHGSPDSPPPQHRKYWGKCQHASWFFLSWHRFYVASFEATVAAVVASFDDGVQDWALPYWNYSEDLADNPNARLMPPAFRDRRLPGGKPNALWSRRASVSDGDFGLDDRDVNLGALDAPRFTGPTTGVAAGFGGLSTGGMGGGTGAIENLPHNRIHGMIGGEDGFMSFTTTAALDPIFWLHHCNIDRLWEAWRRQGGGRDPTDQHWLTARFDMHDGGGAPITFVSADALDTLSVMHGYAYDDAPLLTAGTLEVEMTGGGDDEEGEPELAGANDGPLRLGDSSETIVTLQPGVTNRSFFESDKPDPSHVYLALGNVRGQGAPGDFEVYLDLPNDDKPAAYVGLLTTFGLERASDPGEAHGGSGVSQTFDITDLAERLGLTQSDATQIRVTFRRLAPRKTVDGAPEGLESYVRRHPQPAEVIVGDVKLFFS